MAQIGASAGAAAIFGTTPMGLLAGAAFVAGAGVIDSRFIYPRLLGGQDQKGKPRTIGVPTMTADHGAPRCFAIGRRVRVPVHIMFQADKVREQSSNAGKGGAQARAQVREVHVDMALALNSRPTSRILQLHASGTLVYFPVRNLTGIESSNMSTTVTSGRLVVHMASVLDPDFALVFKPNDVVELQGFSSTPTDNGLWRVYAVTAHSAAAASTVTLEKLDNQTPTAGATSGTPLSPASIYRQDDRAVDERWTVTAPENAGSPGTSDGTIVIQWTTGQNDPSVIFQAGDQVVLANFTPSQIDGRWLVTHMGADPTFGALSMRLQPQSGQNMSTIYGAGAWSSTRSSLAGRIAFYLQQLYLPGVFAAEPQFFNGSETQTESALLAQHFASGSIPGFRGLAYLTTDEWNVTEWGNAPPLIEAILEVDRGMTWDRGLRATLENFGCPADAIDVSRVPQDALDGYAVFGISTGSAAVQPLLVAKQLFAQDRDGVLTFFQLGQADILQVRNETALDGGSDFSDLGTTTNDSQAVAEAVLGEIEETDLPRNMGVTFRDPDNGFADGFISYGVRNPSADGEGDNDRQLDLGYLTIRRQLARDVAANVVRRAWINQRTYEITLPQFYLPALENDLITYTSRDGENHLFRVLSRTHDAGYGVRLQGVREIDVPVIAGSPADGPIGGLRLPPVPVPPVLHVEILDMAPLREIQAKNPGLYLAACAMPGGEWRGARIYLSRDGGNSYDVVGNLDSEAVLGKTLAALADAPAACEDPAAGTGPTWWGSAHDGTKYVDVQLDSTGIFGGLASVTRTDVLNGANWFLIGDEVCAFSTVDLISANTYRLTDGLRGMRRTSFVGHGANDRVVLLTGFEAAGRHLPFPGLATVGSALKFRVVPTGQAFDNAADIDVTLAGWNARPFPPLSVTASASSTDWILSALPHSRLIYPIGSGGPFSFDESFEEYVFVVYTSSSYTTVAANLTLTSRGTGSARLRHDRKFLFTAAAQTSAGLTPGATLHMDVYQVGDYGWSHAARF